VLFGPRDYRGLFPACQQPTEAKSYDDSRRESGGHCGLGIPLDRVFGVVNQVLGGSAPGFDRAPGFAHEVVASVVHNGLCLIDMFAGFRDVIADLFE
jgi:hypothetical protein